MIAMNPCTMIHDDNPGFFSMNYDHFVCDDFEEQCQFLEHAQQFWAPQPPSLSFSQLPSFSSLSPSPLEDHKNPHKNHLNDNNTIITTTTTTTTAKSAEQQQQQQQNHQVIAFHCCEQSLQQLQQQLEHEEIIPSFRFVHHVQAKAKDSVPFYGAPILYCQHQPCQHDSHNIDLSHNPMTDCLEFDELFGGDDDDESLSSFYFDRRVDYPSTTAHHPIRFNLLFAPPPTTTIATTTTTTTTHSHDHSHSSHHHHDHDDDDFPMISKGFSFPRPPNVVPTTTMISHHEQHQLQPTNGLTGQNNNDNDNPKAHQQWNTENNHGDIR